MSNRLLFLFALTVLALTPMASVRADEEDHLWEHHREHCEALAHEEHELREHRDHTPDPVEREHLDHRLHEIELDRDLHCRR